MSHPPQMAIREEGVPQQKKGSRSPAPIVSSTGQEQYYGSGDTQQRQIPAGRKQPIKAKRLPVIKDSSVSRQTKHESTTPRRRGSQKPTTQRDASFRGKSVSLKPNNHFGKKNHSVATTKAQEEKILQLSKLAMNTDSSQMLYPDFTANMQSLPVVQAGDYYDA